ncbi:hypothetical protein BC830DRAFT_1138383 [Chytriomyces sp. MP71]|nr:hypothetical protein BC830DRAFT_1138383 [Chytriomyces sp. MP71]
MPASMMLVAPSSAALRSLTLSDPRLLLPLVLATAPPSGHDHPQSHCVSSDLAADSERKASDRRQVAQLLLQMSVVPLSLRSSTQQPQQQEQYERQPRIFVFAYGSLINSQSLHRTIGTILPSHTASKQQRLSAIPALIHGYTRSWSYKCNRKSYTAVSVTPSISRASRVNGVLVPILSEQLSLLDSRECGYNRTQVSLADVSLYSSTFDNFSLHPSDIVFMYTEPVVAHKACPMVPIPQSYVDCIAVGALEYGVEFARDFVALTAGWASHWVNDRRAVAPVRRYVPDMKAGETEAPAATLFAVDAMLKSLVPHAFSARVEL